MYRPIMSTATNAVVQRSGLIRIQKNNMLPGYGLGVLAAFVAVLAGPASACPREDFRNSSSVERLHRASSDRAQAMSQAHNDYGPGLESCAYQYHGGPKSAWTCGTHFQPTHSGGR
jgi:hypothetical protein